MNELVIVVDMEDEPPSLLGTYLRTSEDVILYTTTEGGVAGRIEEAPQDSVRVVTVKL